MRVLVIPDVHGSHHWEKVKSIPKEDYDYAIFLGDYFDCWSNSWPDQGENFQNICNWIREDTDHRKMVLGNHDWSYISGTRYGASCSGHQAEHASDIKKYLTSNIDIIDIAEEIDGWIFSHAGFTHFWVNSMKECLHHTLDKWPEEDDGEPLSWDESEFSIKLLNEEFHKLSHLPGDKNFNYEFDELLDWRGYYSGAGNEITQGPFWVRPNSLLKDAYYKNHIVGHTEYGIGGPAFLSENDNNVVLMDSVSHSNVMIIDTTNLPKFQTTAEFNKNVKLIQTSIKNYKSIGAHKSDVIPAIMKQFSISEVSATDWVELYEWNE